MVARIQNRNVGDVIGAARALGVEVLGYRNSKRHPAVRLRTSEGVEFWMRVSQGRIEPHKQKGWLRQAINRANKRKANDNGTC